MAAETPNPKHLPPLTLGLIITSVALVAVAVAGFVWPQYRAMAASKQARMDKTVVLETQKRLYPVYAKAKGLADFPFDPRLPVPERSPLDRREITHLSQKFARIALDNHMSISENSIDVSAYKEASDHITTEIQFAGTLFDFRNCLIQINQLPFFNRIETIGIAAEPEGIKKFKTKLRINIRKS